MKKLIILFAILPLITEAQYNEPKYEPNSINATLSRLEASGRIQSDTLNQISKDIVDQKVQQKSDSDKVSDLVKAVEDMKNRIGSLENWKFWFTGAAAAIGAIVSLFFQFISLKKEKNNNKEKYDI